MTDYRLRLIVQAVTAWMVVAAATVLAVQGSISGSDAMVVLIGTAGTSAGAAAAIGREPQPVPAAAGSSRSGTA